MFLDRVVVEKILKNSRIHGRYEEEEVVNEIVRLVKVRIENGREELYGSQERKEFKRYDRHC